MAKRGMANGKLSGFQLSWQTLIMSVGLFFVLVGGFWTLAYIPIQESLKELKNQVIELRDADARTRTDITSRFISLREHDEFKNTVREQLTRIFQDIHVLSTTRSEFLSEIKRLDQLNQGDMKRVEFEAWKSERDKIITVIQDRQNRFAEALDSMYSKITTQPQSFPERR